MSDSTNISSKTDNKKAACYYKQAGGHDDNIVVDGNKMIKTTKPSEVENYERIFRDNDFKFQKLIPHYFYGGGAAKTTKVGDHRQDHHDDDDEVVVRHSITIENSLYDRENASTLGASEEM